jgi:hypothetical protein
MSHDQLNIIQSQAEQKIFLFSKTDCLWHPHSLLHNGYHGVSPKLQWPRCESDHSPPSSTKVKNEWCYTPSPPICLHSTDRDNFSLIVFHIFVYLQALCLQSFCHIIQYSGDMTVWYFWDCQSHLLGFFKP